VVRATSIRRHTLVKKAQYEHDQLAKVSDKLESRLSIVGFSRKSAGPIRDDQNGVFDQFIQEAHITSETLASWSELFLSFTSTKAMVEMTMGES
jgi:hypothetical protein